MQGFARRAAAGVMASACLIALVGAAPAHAGALTSAEITAEVSKKKIYFNRSTKIRGTLTTSSPAGRTVTLYERLYPYTAETVVGTTTTDAEGDYAFTGIEPGFNARYRAAVTQPTDATSEELAVWVYPRFDVNVRVTGFRRGKTKLDMFFAPDYPVDLDNRPSSVYFRKGGRPFFHRIERSRTNLAAPGHLVDEAGFRIPGGHYGRFWIAWCTEVTDVGEDTGMYKPPSDQKCPRRFRFRLTHGLKAASPRPPIQARAGRPIAPSNL
jgi:hypothetical protein